MLQLLTAKPILYVCNVDEDSAATGQRAFAKRGEDGEAEGRRHVVISAAIEEEIAQLGRRGPRSVSGGNGAGGAGLDRLIRTGYQLLEPDHLFHRAAQRKPAPGRSRTASGAAGGGRDPYGDFETGFIRSETIAHDDYVACGASRARRMRARCGWKARTTSSPMATLCISGLHRREGARGEPFGRHLRRLVRRL